MLGKNSWTYLVLGKSSWTYLVLLSYGRSSTGPHLVGIKSISLYIRRACVPRSALGLHSARCPVGRSPPNTVMIFPMVLME